MTLGARVVSVDVPVVRLTRFSMTCSQKPETSRNAGDRFSTGGTRSQVHRVPAYGSPVPAVIVSFAGWEVGESFGGSAPTVKARANAAVCRLGCTAPRVVIVIDWPCGVAGASSWYVPQKPLKVA